MGIKFLCSQCGHKLNVKSFLAGKKGICPHCQARVDIPGQRQEKVRAGGSAPAGDAQRAALEALGLDPGPAPMAMPTGPMTAAPTAMPVGAPAAHPRPAPAYPATAAMPAHPMASPVGAGPAQHVAFATPQPMAAMPAMPAAPMAPPPPPAPVAPAPLDPIAEAPNAVWYVRPPSGGQFGPAAGDTMRKWVGEGRVTAESLIWREGWADWKKAGAAFPSLGGGAAPAISGPVVSQKPSGSSTSVPRPAPAGNQMAIVIVVLLVVLTIILLGVLIFVLNRMPGGSSDDKKGTAHFAAPGIVRQV